MPPIRRVTHDMAERIRERRRLAPIVGLAYAILHGEVPIVDAPASPLAPQPGVESEESLIGRIRNDPPGHISEETYAAMISAEIASNYSFPRRGLPTLLERVRSGSLGPFSEADAHTAVELLDELIQSALFVESRLGDGPDAVRELASTLPGFEAALYEQIIGWCGYKNH